VREIGPFVTSSFIPRWITCSTDRVGVFAHHIVSRNRNELPCRKFIQLPGASHAHTSSAGHIPELFNDCTVVVDWNMFGHNVYWDVRCVLFSVWVSSQRWEQYKVGERDAVKHSGSI
jgi:hypothetical protein